MKLLFKLLICFQFAVISITQAGADVYKYIDNSGAVVFTDDISKVPVEQRESAFVDKAIESEDGTSSPPEKVKAEEPINWREIAEGIESDKEKDALATPEDGSQGQNTLRKSLEQMQIDLKAESEALTARRNELTGKKRAVNTEEGREEYNEKVKALNSRIEAYKQKEKQLMQKIKAYNLEIEKKQGLE